MNPRHYFTANKGDFVEKFCNSTGSNNIVFFANSIFQIISDSPLQEYYIH